MSTLHENFNRHWTHSKSTSPKLTFYHHVKKNFKCEVYLHDVKRFTDRAALTQLRISAHDLNIETGRYLQQSREERLCEWCHLVTSSNNIETEKHVLLECDLYSVHRREFITFARSTINPSNAGSQTITTSNNNINLFIPLDENPQYNRRLSNTVSNILKTRKKFIDSLNNASN